MNDLHKQIAKLEYKILKLEEKNRLRNAMLFKNCKICTNKYTTFEISGTLRSEIATCVTFSRKENGYVYTKKGQVPYFLLDKSTFDTILDESIIDERDEINFRNFHALVIQDNTDIKSKKYMVFLNKHLVKNAEKIMKKYSQAEHSDIMQIDDSIDGVTVFVMIL